MCMSVRKFDIACTMQYKQGEYRYPYLYSIILLISIPVLRVNTGTTCVHARKQLQHSRCDRTKGHG